MQELGRQVNTHERLTPAESSAWRAWAGHLPSQQKGNSQVNAHERLTPAESSA